MPKTTDQLDLVVEVTEDGQKRRIRQRLHPADYSIGSDPTCAVCVSNSGVSRQHARLLYTPDNIQIEDLGSTNGTYVEGVRIKRRVRVHVGQRIIIGACVIWLDYPKDETVSGQPIQPERAAEPDYEPPPIAPQQEEPAPSPSDPARALMRKFKAQIHTELLKRLDLKRLIGTNSAATKSLQEKVRVTVTSIVNEIKDQLPASITPANLTREIIQEAIGLGPLDDLLEDGDITEIMVNGPDKIFVERRGKIQLTERTFVDDAQVLAIIERIVAPIGKRIDESSPYVDARLADGSRVNAIIAPLSLKGPTITIRKFAKTPFTVADLIRFGTMTEQIADFMRICVLLRKNIIISGGTGSGKTTLLNVLSNFLPKDERIVTIEDTAELRLNQQHIVSLEARPANIEGRGAVTIRDLVRNALRMRPDRIVVGECRGGESLDMLQAMNTGHDGSLTTVHANSPRDTISRMETMVLMAGMELPSRAIREQIAAAVDIICHTDRLSDGTRRVTKVSEVTGMEKDVVVMQDMFIFKQTGLDPRGKVLGYFTATGSVPTFIDEVRTRGLQLDRSVFTQQVEQMS
ncbi:MAG: Flp pilus assembly complex ATPase component TadA [Verrucomicrobia bacterium]|nr:Flp pilus assembly complex ATPase component TadA [Verrucomicrobiota bacterium]